MRPKITIFKKKILNDLGHYRYYNLTSSGVTLDLDANSDSNYSFLNVRTERELCLFILQHFGEGDYKISGHLKGRRGTWTFWKGHIDNEGYEFEGLNSRKFDKDLMNAEQEVKKAETSEEKAMAQEDYYLFQEQKKDLQEENKASRYGFRPFLKSSGRRGEFHSWEEPDEGFQENNYG